MNFIPVLQAAAPAGNSFIMPITLVLVFFIFYFFMIRPQKKEQKKMKEMIASLKKGDKIITIGGIHGTISGTKETTVIIKVDDNCKIEVNRKAIGSIIPKGKAPQADVSVAKPDFTKSDEKK